MLMWFRAISAHDFEGFTAFVSGLLTEGLASSDELCHLSTSASGSSLKLGKASFAKSMDSWSSFEDPHLLAVAAAPFSAGRQYVASAHTLPSHGHRP